NNDGSFRVNHQELAKNPSSVTDPYLSISGIDVYPNPATNSLNVSFKGANAFKITDMIGREMRVGTIENNRIDISALETGNYIIHVFNNNETIGIRKFMKQ